MLSQTVRCTRLLGGPRFRGLRFESSSSIATSGNTTAGGKDDELHILRQKEFNDLIVKQLAELDRTPAAELREELKSAPQLTSKEKQLDEELAQFLTEFSQRNKLLEVQESDDTAADAAGTLSQNRQKAGFPFLVSSARDKPYTKQELFLRQMNHAKHTAKLGANISNVYFPHRDVHNPPSSHELSIAKLMAAGVHLGQSTSLWRSSTQPYIYGEYRGVHIIDLNKTMAHLKRAANVLEGIVENGGVILFLGTREGQKRSLEEAAKRVHGYYVSTRWIPGTLTNSTEISSVWEREEVDWSDKPTGRPLSYNEKLSIVKPDLLVVLNPTENRNALREAMQTRVPTIGIIDTDSEPSLVTYPIPGNDDSLRSVNLILGTLARAGEMGLKKRLAKSQNAESTVA